MSFTAEYYKYNSQEKDRLGLFFYKNIIEKKFKPVNFLDYGCGTGHFLNRVSKIKSVKNTFGFEISDYARILAKKNSKKSQIVKSLHQIEDNSIDFVSALHVIEHIDDKNLSKILLSIKRIIKSNGKILFATPAKDCLAHSLKENNWIGFKDKTHINLKNYEEWKNFFNKNNLELLIASSDGLWDFPYNLKHNKYKIIKIICTMIFQIFSGKLLLSYKDGETFIFLLKFK